MEIPKTIKNVQNAVQDVQESIQDEIASKAVRKSTLKSIQQKKKYRLKKLKADYEAEIREIFSIPRIRSVSRQNMLLQNTHATKKHVPEQNDALLPSRKKLNLLRTNAPLQQTKKLPLLLFRELA